MSKKQDLKESTSQKSRSKHENEKSANKKSILFDKNLDVDRIDSDDSFLYTNNTGVAPLLYQYHKKDNRNWATILQDAKSSKNGNTIPKHQSDEHEEDYNERPNNILQSTSTTTATFVSTDKENNNSKHSKRKDDSRTENIKSKENSKKNETKLQSTLFQELASSSLYDENEIQDKSSDNNQNIRPRSSRKKIKVLGIRPKVYNLENNRYASSKNEQNQNSESNSIDENDEVNNNEANSKNNGYQLSSRRPNETFRSNQKRNLLPISPKDRVEALLKCRAQLASEYNNPNFDPSAINSSRLRHPEKSYQTAQTRKQANYNDSTYKKKPSPSHETIRKESPNRKTRKIRNDNSPNSINEQVNKNSNNRYNTNNDPINQNSNYDGINISYNDEINTNIATKYNAPKKRIRAGNNLPISNYNLVKNKIKNTSTENDDSTSQRPKNNDTANRNDLPIKKQETNNNIPPRNTKKLFQGDPIVFQNVKPEENKTMNNCITFIHDQNVSIAPTNNNNINSNENIHFKYDEPQQPNGGPGIFDLMPKDNTKNEKMVTLNKRNQNNNNDEPNTNFDPTENLEKSIRATLQSMISKSSDDELTDQPKDTKYNYYDHLHYSDEEKLNNEQIEKLLNESKSKKKKKKINNMPSESTSIMLSDKESEPTSKNNNNNSLKNLFDKSIGKINHDSHPEEEKNKKNEIEPINGQIVHSVIYDQINIQNNPSEKSKKKIVKRKSNKFKSNKLKNETDELINPSENKENKENNNIDELSNSLKKAFTSSKPISQNNSALNTTEVRFDDSSDQENEELNISLTKEDVKNICEPAKEAKSKQSQLDNMEKENEGSKQIKNRKKGKT